MRILMARIARTRATARMHPIRWRWTAPVATAMVAMAAVPAQAVQIRVPRASPPRIEVRPPIGTEPTALRDALESAQPTLRERFEASAAQITADLRRQELLKDCLVDASEDAVETFVQAVADEIPADYDAIQAAAVAGCVTSVFPEAVQYRADQVADSLAGQADAIASEAVQSAATSPEPAPESDEETPIDPAPEEQEDSSSFPVWIIVVALLGGGGLFVLIRSRAR